MKTTNDFFIPDNEVKLPEELDYSCVDEYIRSAEAFSRSTYQSVYIIDYFKQNFLYVSPNPMFLCGLTPEQVMKLGYRFYLEYVPEDEQQFLIDLNEAGFSFHNTIPVKERKDWYISYDFNILNGGRKILVNIICKPDLRQWAATYMAGYCAFWNVDGCEWLRDSLSDIRNGVTSNAALKTAAHICARIAANIAVGREVKHFQRAQGLVHLIRL